MITVNDKKYCNLKEVIQYVEENTLSRRKLYYHVMKDKFQKEISSQYNLDNNVIIDTEQGYHIEFDYLNENVELLNKSVELPKFCSSILEFTSYDKLPSLIRTVAAKHDVYKIPFFDKGISYLDSSLSKEIFNKTKELYEKKCIPRKKVIEKIHSKYAGYTTSPLVIGRLIDKAVDENNLEVIPGDDKFNFLYTNNVTYPQKTVQKILQYFEEKLIKEDLHLVNMSYEDYLSLSIDDFKNNYKEFTKDDAERIGWNAKYFQLPGEINRQFKDTDVRIFKFNKQVVYVNKKDFDELVNLVDNYIPAASYFRELGIEFKSQLALNNGIGCITNKRICYIKKTDIENYKTLYNYTKEFQKTESLYGRVKLKIDTYPHKKGARYPNATELILKYAKSIKRNKQESSKVLRVYDAILDNIKFDLVPSNQSENNKLFRSVLNNFGTKAMRLNTIAFMNFLCDKEGFDLMSASDIGDMEEKEPYTPEEFINLLSAMLMVTSDEQKISKLYRDWRLSTAFSYVFLHYCLAWRKTDFVDSLPMVNLSLISDDITDGESFIKWLEDGNKLSDDQSKYICESIEEETSRLRKKASKNSVLLSCIISDALMCEVATLLCINEANRQIYFNNSNNSLRTRTRSDRCFIKPYTNSGKIYDEFSKKLDIDINKILNGNFDNIRMNKGFMHLVRDKAEELNLFAYTHIQLLRAHKSTHAQLSETTKIYLNKTIDKSSLLAFSTGTMGSVLYILKQLVDDDFSFKTINEQIKDIKDLNITPYELEENIHSISNKITVLTNEMKRYFASQGTKENFLKRLLYGQSFSGIEAKTKCLIKITRDEENIIRISPIDCEKTTPNNKCPLNRRSCIGCDYMIALRYFIYEFENKFNQILTNLENAESKLDKENFTQMINTLYVPLLNDLSVVLGVDKVYEVVDLDRYSKLVQSC